MLWVYDHFKYFYSYSAGIDFSPSESDVYRRQILTTKVDPRAVRVTRLHKSRSSRSELEFDLSNFV